MADMNRHGLPWTIRELDGFSLERIAVLFTDFSRLDRQRLPSPCFVVDEVAIERNLQILQQVAEASGARILAALKAFSMWQLGPWTAPLPAWDLRQRPV